MKFSVCFYFLFYYFDFLFVHCNRNENGFSLKSHLEMVHSMNLKSNLFLNKLYNTVNNNLKTERDDIVQELVANKMSKNEVEKIRRDMSAGSYTNEFNTIPTFRYRDYRNINKTLHDLAKEFPDLVKLSTAQKDYGLPHPGGRCKGEKCVHHIVHLSNHTNNSTTKPQIFFSGEVHGDERIGPTAVIELLLLIINNRNHPWFDLILRNRMIVIVPLVNPHGYTNKIREELLIDNENEWTLTERNKRYNETHKDINRDFPYLVKESECMETIGARVINELFMSHLFTLGLSIHSGEESLTYPYGTPNHLKNSPKIPMKYKLTKKGGVKAISFDASVKVADIYKESVYDYVEGPGTLTPDSSGIIKIAKSISDFTSPNGTRRYPTGDANGVLYPVRGGMEDWAYSGSWEGFPIIHSCKPKTYNGYKEEKTDYRNKTEALKTVMFLLEASNNKFPSQNFLGRNSTDCILNIRPNAFFNNVTSEKKLALCKMNFMDGFIPKILRLSLALIDLLEPYVNFRYGKAEEHVDIEWVVGGAISVDETFVLYDYVTDYKKLEEDLKKTTNNTNVFKMFKNKTKVRKGNAIWSDKFNTKSDHFRETIPLGAKGKYLVFLIAVKVDQNWNKTPQSEPEINPQTHIVNLRTRDNFKTKNGKYSLIGQKYFTSELGLVYEK